MSADHVEEREVKLAVPPGFALPSLGDLGVTATDRGDHTLRAVYWDSADLVLARAGVGLRHRNGTWTYKGGSRREGDAVVREELEVGAPGDTIPARLAERFGELCTAAALHPIAALETVRHTVDVADGQLHVELVHDRASVIADDEVVSTFEEVEVEFPPDSRDLADRVVALLLRAGARVDPTPKLLRALRALGHDPPEVTL